MIQEPKHPTVRGVISGEKPQNRLPEERYPLPRGCTQQPD